MTQSPCQLVPRPSRRFAPQGDVKGAVIPAPEPESSNNIFHSAEGHKNLKSFIIRHSERSEESHDATTLPTSPEMFRRKAST